MTTALEFITAYDCRECGGTGYIGGEVICPDCVAVQKQYQAMKRAERIASETPQDAPKTNDDKRMVAVGHIGGEVETDPVWLARQAELEDYRQTMDAASIYGQGV